MTLDGDDVGLDTLDQGEDRGRHSQAVLQRGVDPETCEVQVKRDTLLCHPDHIQLSGGHVDMLAY